MGVWFLSPPEHAIILLCHEKSHIQALDRTQPGLPINQGRYQTMPHDYKRNRPTSLFAALNITDVDQIPQPDRPDNPKRQGGPHHLRQLLDPQAHQGGGLAEAAPPFPFSFTSTSASWLNIVERFFRDLTDKGIR